MQAGIRAILNFSPGTLKVPPGVKLKNVDLTVSLESLSFFLAREEADVERPKRQTLSHVDARGRVRMVDVSAKPETEREAIAEAHVRMNRAARTAIESGASSRAIRSGRPVWPGSNRAPRRRVHPDSPSATASRAVSGLADTSTMRTRPRASTCESRRAGSTACFGIGLLSRQEERQALERDGQIDVLELHARRDFQRAGREIQDRANPGMHGGVHDPLRRVGGHGHDRDVDAVALDDFLNSLMSKMRTPPFDRRPIFDRSVSNSATIAKPS